MRASVRGVLWVGWGLVGCQGPTVSLPDDDGKDDTVEDTDTTPAADDSDTTPPTRLEVGDLVITEFLIESRVCAGQLGQMVELYNTTASTITLQGLSIGNGLTTGDIGSGTIRPGDYAYGAPSNSGDCHGIGADFTYEPVELSATRGGLVELWAGDRLMDVVDITGWDMEPGVAWSVDPRQQDPLVNDDPTAWCLARGNIGTTVDSGTFGRASPECPEGERGGVVVPMTVDQLEEGDLIVSEMMLRPESCRSNVGQYLELYNASGRRLSLEGLLLSDGLGFAGLDQRIEMPVDTYTYIGAGDFSSHCYLAGLLPAATWGSELVFDDEEVIIGYGSPFLALDTVPLERLDTDRGVALQLDSGRLNGDDNDLATSWCNSQPPITGALDRGTPGQPNVVCPAPGTPAFLGNELLPGDLIITEAMFDAEACSDNDAEYFEVYNATGSLIDLRGLTMVINGSTVTLQNSYQIAEDTWALAEIYTGHSPAGCYVGLQHDFLFDTPRMPDFGTEIRLLSDFGVVDVVNLTGRATIPGSALQLHGEILSAALNDDPFRWCHATRAFQGSFGDLGSPKQANELCDDLPEIDSADTGPEPEPPPPPVSVLALDPGDLIITEFAPNPEDCSDFSAEYIEIYNNTDSTVNLNDLMVTIGGTVSRVFQNNIPLLPRGYGTLRYTSGAAPACYGFVGHAWYDVGKMNDVGTTLRISNGAEVFDEVYATGWPAIEPGKAMTLDPDFLDASQNDGAEHWCAATSSFVGGFIDRGSPNAANADCPQVVVPTDTDTDADTDGPIAIPRVQASQLTEGDLVITEMMANPADCSDFAAEYIELYNNTDSEVDLTGLEVMVNGTTRAVSQVLDPIPPRSYGTLRYTTGAAPACYGFDANAWYDSSKMNDDGSNVRVANGAGMIDQVFAAGWGAFTEGVSVALDPRFLEAALNDDEEAWCRSTDRFLGSQGDLGSPGEANAECLVTDTSPFGDTFEEADSGALTAPFTAPPTPGPLFSLWETLWSWWAP